MVTYEAEEFSPLFSFFIVLLNYMVVEIMTQAVKNFHVCSLSEELAVAHTLGLSQEPVTYQASQRRLLIVA